MKTVLKTIFQRFLPNPIPGQIWFLDGIGLAEVITVTESEYVYFFANGKKRRTFLKFFKISGYIIEKKYNINQLTLDLNTPNNIQFNMKRILQGFGAINNAA